MNYAQDKQYSELIQEFSSWLDQPSTEHSRQKWLLVDGAIVGEKITKKLLKAFGKAGAYNTLSGSEFSAYAWRSPHLFDLSNCAFSRIGVFELLKNSAGLPAISFIEGGSDAKIICEHLLWLARVRTIDGFNMYCRFADTRITEPLMKVLYEQQKATLLSCVIKWQIVGRNGHLITVLNSDAETGCQTDNSHENENPDPLILTDKQYLYMMRAAEADEIFHMLCEGAPELVPLEGLAEFHVLLFHLIHAARTRSIEHLAEVYQFVVIGLTTHTDFFLNPVLEDFWRQFNSGKRNFSVLVSEWTDDRWNCLIQDSLHNSPCKAMA